MQNFTSYRLQGKAIITVIGTYFQNTMIVPKRMNCAKVVRNGHSDSGNKDFCLQSIFSISLLSSFEKWVDPSLN